MWILKNCDLKVGTILKYVRGYKYRTLHLGCREFFSDRQR
jgi:hypothetical protein